MNVYLYNSFRVRLRSDEGNIIIDISGSTGNTSVGNIDQVRDIITAI